MEKESVLKYLDYKLYLKAIIETSKPRRGIIAKMAEAATCQPSYLSQVLISEVQLTPEHALGLSEFLGLDSSEQEYFLLLVDFARAGNAKLKHRLNKRLSELKIKSEDIAHRLNRPRLDVDESNIKYYSSWIWSAVHILLTIPECQTVEKIANRLGLTENTTIFYLENLEKMGFVLRQESKWLHSGREVHIPKESSLVSMHHNNWRQAAVLNSQYKIENNIHFTGIYAISDSDFERIKEIIYEALSKSNSIALGSAEKKLICLNFDFFEV